MALPARAATARVVLAVHAPDGGRWRLPLRYTARDVDLVTDVLVEIGGVAPGDVVRARAASGGDFTRAVEAARHLLHRARRAGQRTELIFYYSGHADETGLLLGNDHVDYRAVKRTIESLPAHITVAIVDACASGALVRSKGGRRAPPFLDHAHTDIAGSAWLTSSSVDETSQESEVIAASYFTYYLVTGLRGAADHNRDGLVTLSEAYTYAFDATLARTATSAAGPQHPNYAFSLTGSGQWVVTDLRNSSATIAFDPAVAGVILVRAADGRVVAELDKRTGRSVRIAVPPQSYEVVLRQGDRIRVARVHLRPHASSALRTADFHAAPDRVASAEKGTDPQAVIAIPAALTFVPPLSTNPRGANVRNHIAFNFIGAGYQLSGLELGILANRRVAETRGVQWAIGMNRTHQLVGAQLGAYNLARGSIRGVQLGAVNRATAVHGAQIGLVNIARTPSRSVQLGVINWMSHGLLSVGMWTSDVATINAAVKMGGLRTYSLLGVAADTYADWSGLLWGWGAHFEGRRTPLWFEIDTTITWIEPGGDGVRVLANEPWNDPDQPPAQRVLDNPVDILLRARFTVGLRIAQWVSFYGGPAWNLLLSERRREIGALAVTAVRYKGDLRIETSPGFFAGLSIEPHIGTANRGILERMPSRRRSSR